MTKTPITLAALAMLTPSALAAPAAVANRQIELWPLFVQSLDVFTALLLIGSVTAAWLITLRVMDLRPSVILPQSSIDRADDLVRNDRIGELRSFADAEDTMIARAVRAALAEEDRGHEAMLDAGELAASDETARLYRSIDLLNVIGNLGPLIGLAGTVWGMILAFTSLGATDGQAGPADLSLGISKALFHTLLGLLLAIPCLTAYAIFRNIVDRTATVGMSASSRTVERLAEKLHPNAHAATPAPNLPPLGPFRPSTTTPPADTPEDPTTERE